jgi:hypothetical protein
MRVGKASIIAAWDRLAAALAMPRFPTFPACRKYADKPHQLPRGFSCSGAARQRGAMDWQPSLRNPLAASRLFVGATR